jgi:hypothetical protein
MAGTVADTPAPDVGDADNERRDERRRKAAEDAAALGMTTNPTQQPAKAGEPPYWLR